MSKQTYNFSIVFEPFNGDLVDIEDSIFDAGCDDALFGIRANIPFLDFDRQAGSFVEAVLSAVADVEKANLPFSIYRVEPDDIVNMGEIARRTKFSREYIRKLVEGLKGPGLFPAPFSGLLRRSPLWRWVEVIRWFVERGLIEHEKLLLEAKFVSYVNDMIERRRQERASIRLLESLRRELPAKVNKVDEDLISLAVAIEDKLEHQFEDR